MPQPGSYALISLNVVNVGGQNKLVVEETQIAYMQDDTTPVISVYPGQGDIILPPNLRGQQPRPFAFVVRYDMRGLGAGYVWHSDPTQCVAIGPAGTEPVFGQPLPNGFTGPKSQGGEVTFIDPNNANDRKEYEYRLQLYPAAGGPPIILDPKITNSGSN